MNLSRILTFLLCAALGCKATAQELAYEYSEQARQVVQNIGTYPREGSLQIQLPPTYAESGVPIGSVYTDTNADGIELAIFDGDDWVRVVSRKGDDERIHWYDLFSGEIKDSMLIQDSSYASYKIPRGASYLAVANIIQLPLCAPTTPVLFEKDDVEKSNNLLAEVIAKSRNDPTITVSNMPVRLAVEFADGRSLHARYSKSTKTVIALQGGHPLLEVEEPDYAIKLVCDDSAPQNERLDEVGIQTIELINGLSNPRTSYKKLAYVILDAAEERKRRNSILGLPPEDLIMFIVTCIFSFGIGLCSNYVSQKFSKCQNGNSRKPSKKRKRIIS